jgi:hypothetical protein
MKVEILGCVRHKFLSFLFANYGRGFGGKDSNDINENDVYFYLPLLLQGLLF